MHLLTINRIYCTTIWRTMRWPRLRRRARECPGTRADERAPKRSMTVRGHIGTLRSLVPLVFGDAPLANSRSQPCPEAISRIRVHAEDERKLIGNRPSLNLPV